MSPPRFNLICFFFVFKIPSKCPFRFRPGIISFYFQESFQIPSKSGSPILFRIRLSMPPGIFLDSFQEFPQIPFTRVFSASPYHVKDFSQSFSRLLIEVFFFSLKLTHGRMKPGMGIVMKMSFCNWPISLSLVRNVYRQHYSYFSTHIIKEWNELTNC